MKKFDFDYHKKLVLSDFRAGLLTEEQMEMELDELEHDELLEEGVDVFSDWDYYDD